MKQFALLAILMLPVTSPAADSKTRNIFLLTIDGLRWQEVFRGIDESLAENTQYNKRLEHVRKLYWTDDKTKRAETLMPFLHSTVFKSGVVVGNRDRNSCARVTNPWHFSYPGYSEILTGVVDETLDSNERIQNPNESFLEKLNTRVNYSGKVAAFASWDVFPYILNIERSGLPVDTGQKVNPTAGEQERIMGRLQADIPPPWEHVRFDAFTQHYALSYIERHHPRVVFIGYGEADDFAHDGRYDEYLMAANRTDRFIGELWRFVQNDEIYRGNTIFFITVDHGRGEEPEETWQHHASKKTMEKNEQYLAQYPEGIVGSEAVWMAAMGPGVPVQGLIATGDTCLTSNRVASTLLKSVGEDYRLFNPGMGPPMMEFIE